MTDAGMGAQADALLAALRRRAGAELASTVSSEPWHSGMLVGTRHIFDLRTHGPDAARRLLDGLKIYEFDIAECLVADITGTMTHDGGITVEALVFADA